MVTPVIGFLPGFADTDAANVSKSVDEVDLVFTMSIADMLDADRRGVEQIGKHTIPYFLADDGIKIWGLTGKGSEVPNGTGR
eukprot:m.521523 g.521523  ORF g.521523 m.521523 type:complete len:82 (-) comp21960_c0_seq43:1144-1389(-)